jgi:hypothetical protein
MIKASTGATVSDIVFLSGGLDDDSNCKAGVTQFPYCKKLCGQTALAIRLKNAGLCQLSPVPDLFRQG